MSRETLVTARLSFQKADVEAEMAYSKIIDATGDNPIKLFQDIGTSAEAITVGDTGANSIVLIWNTDLTNYVEIQNGVGGTPSAKLSVNGAPYVAQLADSVSLYAIANTAACRIAILIVPA